MKAKTVLAITLSFCVLIGFAQQPFAEYGYKVKVATLSKGKYVEFFDQDTLIQIGTVVMNRFTRQIISFVTVDTTYSEATLQPELISRWISPDPLADMYYSYSPYHFSGNNPVRFVDPTGMFFIDYHDQAGNKIGTDGNNDGRVVVVTDKKEAKAIKATDEAGGKTAMSQVKSGVELPSAFVRGEMGKAVDRSNSRNDNRTDAFKGDDNEGGFHEEGGIYGTTMDGTPSVVHAKPGPKTDPLDAAMATVAPGIPADPSTDNLEVQQGSFHVHPSGRRTPPPNTIGGSTGSFVQSPTNPQDFNEAKNYSGNSYVLGAGNGTVYIYNGNSTKPIATYPLRKFTGNK
jgi:RHS repeat-associated protein